MNHLSSMTIILATYKHEKHETTKMSLF